MDLNAVVQLYRSLIELIDQQRGEFEMYEWRGKLLILIHITGKTVKGNESGRDNLMKAMLQTLSLVLLLGSRLNSSSKYLTDFEMPRNVNWQRIQSSTKLLDFSGI